MPPLLRRLGSIRLAVALLLLLAAAAVAGTAIPQGLTPEDYQRLFPSTWGAVKALGLDRFYTGWLYRSLLGALALNLLACASGRSAEGWRRFRGRGSPSARFPLGDRGTWEPRLRAAGFTVSPSAPLAARRRPWAFLGFPLVHLGPLLVMAGGLWGSLGGFVGTRNAYVGSTVRTADRWPAGTPADLPFGLRVDTFRLLYHPIALQLSFLLPSGPSPEVEAREGTAVAVPGSPFRVFVQRFDPAAGDLVYFVEDASGRRLGPFSRGREEGAPVRARPTAFRDPETRRSEARLALLGAGGEVLAEHVLAVNEPLIWRGYRVYLTAWGEDRYKNPYVGLQITRDPGQGLVWVGSVALALGLFLMLFGDGAWAREEGGELWVRAGRRTVQALRGEGSAPDEGQGAPSGGDPSGEGGG